MARDIAAENERIFHSAAMRCKPTWRCVVCGAKPKQLLAPNPSRLDQVMCSTCRFRYTLRSQPGKVHARYVPKSVMTVGFRREYIRAYIHFDSGIIASHFIARYADWQDAHNALNRLQTDPLPLDDCGTIPLE